VADLDRQLDPELLAMYTHPRPGMRTILTTKPKVIREDRTVRFDGARVPVRTYRRTDAPADAPAMLYIHGGGFVAGSPVQFDPLCDYYAHELGCVVVSPAYRLAPAHPYPAAIQDAYTALRWLAGSAGEIGADAKRLAIVGTSAGGAIAAGLALLARDRSGPAVKLVMLHSPCLDDRHETASSHQITHAGIWNRTASQASWQHYLGNSRKVEPYAAPARATDLSGLPATYLSVGQLEVGRDETIEYARRLSEAGVPTELHLYPGAPHGFEVKAPEAGVSQASLRAQLLALRHAFSR
jgi:acetyl esterase